MPAEDLFMMGKTTKRKLDKLNINTIGELALFDFDNLENIFKSHGNYANGIENSEVK